MNRDRHGRPEKRRPETSKLSVTVHGSTEFEIDAKNGLFLIAGCLVLSAAILSFAGCSLAAPVSYVGVALGLFANVASERQLISINVAAQLELVAESGMTASVDFGLSVASIG